MVGITRSKVIYLFVYYLIICLFIYLFRFITTLTLFIYLLVPHGFIGHPLVNSQFAIEHHHLYFFFKGFVIYRWTISIAMLVYWKVSCLEA